MVQPRLNFSLTLKTLNLSLLRFFDRPRSENHDLDGKNLLIELLFFLFLVIGKFIGKT